LFENAVQKLEASARIPPEFGPISLKPDNKGLRSFREPTKFPPKKRGAAYSQPLRLKPNLPMSNLYLIVKSDEVLGCESRERDQFWMEACHRNNLEFTQIKARWRSLDPEISNGSSMSRSFDVPGKNEVTELNEPSKITTAVLRQGVLPIPPLKLPIPAGGSEPRISQAAGCSDSSEATSSRTISATGASKNLSQQEPVNPGTSRPILSSNPDVPLSATTVDRSRDPRLNRAIELSPVRHNPPGVELHQRQVGEDHHRLCGDCRSDVEYMGNDSYHLGQEDYNSSSPPQTWRFDGPSHHAGFDGQPRRNFIDEARDPRRSKANPDSHTGQSESRPDGTRPFAFPICRFN
jgi:hypothetical protein